MTFNKLNYFVYVFLIFVCCAKTQKCSNGRREYENHLASKTPYRIVGNYNSSEIKYDGCEARKFWALVRHGTRNPSVKLIERMRTRLVEIRDLLLENLSEGTEQIHNLDLDLFRAWSTKLRDKDEKKLTHEGEDEMLLLAERFQSRFPTIFSNIYSDSLFKFKYTHSQRTKKSAEAFTAGLFGRGVVRDVNFLEPEKRDPILRFYKLCEKWRKEVKNNPEVLAEMRKFQSGPIMTKTIEAVNKRLGFNDELDLYDVHTMYMTCACETAWNKRKRSPWCSVFSLEDFKVLEYGEDLKYYWVDGYGHELTYKQACRAFNDVAVFFQNNETLPKATVYFTHSGTLLKMLAHMELYKEQSHLISDDYEINSNRKYRVGKMDSFGTNLAFVLFDCKGQEKVLTLHQEHVIRLPTCPDSDLCNLEEIIDYYAQSVECPFDEMCGNEV